MVVVLVVTVVCGVVCVLCAPVVLLAKHAQVHQSIGKPQHIGDRRKALNEMNQTITFN